MKRIVFLWFIAVILMNTVPTKASSTDNTFYANNTEITVSNISINERKLTFSGEANFEVILGSNETLVGVNGVTYHNEYFIVYGFMNEAIIDPMYDGFIIAYNLDGEEIYNRVFDLDEQEEFKGAYLLGENLIFHLRQSITNENGDHEQEFDYFIRFDETYEDYDYTRFKQEIKRIEVIEDSIYVSEQVFGDYFAAFNTTFDILYNGVMYGAVNHGTYYDEVELTLLNGGYVNNEYINKDILITYPGYYSVHYANRISTFVLHPIIRGIEANQVTNEAVSVYVSNGYLTLNDDVYMNESTISDPGYYVLKVEGLNQYNIEIPFTITSNLEGIYHNQRYDSPRTITFNGLAYLNNRLIESPYRIDESGLYTLSIYGENGYQENHQFELAITETTTPIKESLMYVEITLLALGFTGLFVLFIKFKKQSNKTS